jgi:hypothetical protein
MRWRHPGQLSFFPAAVRGDWRDLPQRGQLNRINSPSVGGGAGDTTGASRTDSAGGTWGAVLVPVSRGVEEPARK